MSNFDYMNFTGGKDDEFVVHAAKFTKAEAIELFCSEHEPCYYREPKESDIEERYVRWYIRVPDFCGYDSDGTNGCYSYASAGTRGSFKVWVFNLSKLRERTKQDG